ncbi:hypothetical protein L2E82_50443 [Cichorium intybus]|nr:hypothetical protein L2E82_50443 [Cichorium intybus]
MQKYQNFELEEACIYSLFQRRSGRDLLWDRVAISSGSRFCAGHYPTRWSWSLGRVAIDKRIGSRYGRVAMGRWIGSRSRRVAIDSRSFVSKASRVCHLDRVAIWLEIGSRSMLFQPFSSFVLFFFILRHMSCWVAIAVAG